MDIFIGKWRKSQEKALLKAMDETIKLTKQGIINYNFDDIVDKYTLYNFTKNKYLFSKFSNIFNLYWNITLIINF